MLRKLLGRCESVYRQCPGPSRPLAKVPRRAGMTLLELLVILGVAAVLLALAVPAIQKVREVANKAVCASNLRQLALAAQLYHNDRGKLPPGYLGPSLANNINYPLMFDEGQWIGHLPLLLPYLDQRSLAQQIQVSFDAGVVSQQKWFWAAPAPGPGPPHVGNYTAAMQPLKIFRCPSASEYTVPIGDPSPTGGGTTVGMHVFNSPAMGVLTVWWRDEYGPASPYRPLGRTNYMGVAGCGSGTHPVFSRYEGLYVNRLERTLGEVTAADGTSNTLLYGETCGSAWPGPPETQDICWMAGGGLGTYLGLRRGRTALHTAFSSYHTGGVNFAFADGSVRLVRFGATEWSGRRSHPFPADWQVLQELAGWRDGGHRDASPLRE